VYAAGMVFDVPVASFTIPIDRKVVVGICVHTRIVTYIEDPTLRGNVAGSRAYGEPTADRLQVTAVWTWDGAGTCDGNFYGVYEVDYGYLPTVPPSSTPADDALARYDREANGHYVVKGYTVRALGFFPAAGGTPAQQSFSIDSGTINVWGYKLDLLHSYRLNVPEEPDINEVLSEPHIVSGSPQVITVNHAPVTQVLGVTLTKQATSENVVHGAYSGVSDALAHTSIAQIISIVQGGVTYQLGRDYLLAGDTVSWSPNGYGNPLPAGHAEPAPGSTYQITYQYLSTVTPDAVSQTQITVSGAVTGSTAIVHYKWALPRIDGILVDRKGNIGYAKGQSSIYNPLPPRQPLDQLMIATVVNNWGGTPTVNNTTTLSIHKNQLVALAGITYDLIDLVAQQRLRNDVNARANAASRGVFVDPFISDAMRDTGVAQDASIVSGTLNLPFAMTVLTARPQNTPYRLPYVEEALIIQGWQTGCMRINPYQVFDPLPAKLSITPAYDFWTTIQNVYNADITNYFVRVANGSVANVVSGAWAFSTERALQVIANGRFDANHPLLGTTRDLVSTNVVSTDRFADPALRSQAVSYTVTGLGAGEILKSLSFDGVNILPAPAPVADANGSITGTFTIPLGLPSGTKIVQAQGMAGLPPATATYVGKGTVEINTIQRAWNVTLYEQQDPLAQTFRLTDSRQITSVDVQFCAIGNTANRVVCQVREVSLGLPTPVALNEGALDMHSVAVNQWQRIPFNSPTLVTSSIETALVLMTDDGYHAVKIAELGGFDTVQQAWATSNPYTVGTLLSSSNNSTWSPHPKDDLMFRLNAARYTATTMTVEFGAFNLVNATHLIAVAAVDLPSTDTQATVIITRADGSIQTAQIGQPIPLGARVTETIHVAIRLDGTATLSPVLYPLLQLFVGNQADAGLYVSRAVPAGTDSRIDIVIECITPGSSAIAVDAGMEASETASVGYTSSLAIAAATPTGDGWVERTYTLRHYQGADARARINLAGSPANPPQVRNLRMSVTADPVNVTGG